MAETGVEVRTAVAGDEGPVGKLIAQLWPSTAFDQDVIRTAFRAGLNAPNCQYWVAEIYAIPIGMISLSWSGNIFEAAFRVGMIDELVVDENWRGRGIGERLVDVAADFARQRGLAALELTTAGHRDAAHRFYESRGFSRRETRVYWRKLS